MLTKPTMFGEYYQNDGVPKFTIVKIVQGSDTWLFSTQDMQLSDGFVSGLLISHSGIKRSVDFLNSEVSIGNVTLTLNNLPYNPVDTNIRLSDEWGELYYADVTIYLGAGPNIAALSDCLTVFTGKVGDAPQYNPNTITVVAVDISKFVNKILPTTKVSSIYADAPESSRNLKIPIIYGTFSYPGGNGDGTVIMNGPGPAPTVLVGDGLFCLSDHVLYSVESFWCWNDVLGMSVEVKASDVSMSADDSSRGTATIDVDGTGEAFAYLYPGGVDTVANDATNPMNAARDSGNTYALIVSSGDTLSLKYTQDYGPSDKGTDMENGVGEIYSTIHQWRAIVATGATHSSYLVTIKNSFASQTDNSAPTLDGITWNSINGATQETTGLRWSEEGYGTFWVLNRGSADTHGPVILQHLEGGTPSGGELLYIYCMRIKQRFTYQPSVMTQGFAECHGREFGSWIDHADHSNAYDEGDQITQPAYIIESILIDELGVSSSNIDHASFDAAADANLNMNLAIHTDDQRWSDEIIREICGQSGFICYLSPSGKWKLLSWLKDYTGADATIHYSDLVEPPTIYRTPRNNIINDLTIYHGYRYDTELTTLTTNVTDSESQTNFGTRVEETTWRLLDEDSVDYLAPFYVGTGGLLSREWPIVKITTKEFIWADLEIGDFVTLDADTFDVQLKNEGIGWYERPFMVAGVIQKSNGTELYLQMTPGQIVVDLSASIANSIGSAINPTSVTVDDIPPPP